MQQKQVRDTLYDAEQRTLYSKMHADAMLVDPAASAAKLVGLLNANEFESGAHIDYYDD